MQTRPGRTAVCVLRLEARGETGVLITITTTPDVNTIAPGRARAVGNVEEALSVVAGFLRGFQFGAPSNHAPLDGHPDSRQRDT
jgi:hypothetical protein